MKFLGIEKGVFLCQYSGGGAMSKISVKINGKNVELQNSLTVAEMLLERNVTGSMFVVEKNLQILPKDKYDNKLEENDSFEIVGFFGGG